MNRDETFVYTVKEAAAALRISVAHLYQLKSSNEISFVKMGKCLRFTPKNLHDYVAKCARKTERQQKHQEFAVPENAS
tara:strand:- start:1482 stop:1715 length:234 start_codon:yes stop_codon:yes gene_type:complete